MSLIPFFSEKTEFSSQDIGRIGEDVACMFLVEQGYEVLQRNYRKKYGEIDIVLCRDGKVLFCEVKAVSCEKIESDVNRETKDSHRPEDNVHLYKTRKLSRMIQVYLAENAISESVEWSFCVAAVYVSKRLQKARVCLIDDIVL